MSIPCAGRGELSYTKGSHFRCKDIRNGPIVMHKTTPVAEAEAQGITLQYIADSSA